MEGRRQSPQVGLSGGSPPPGISASLTTNANAHLPASSVERRHRHLSSPQCLALGFSRCNFVLQRSFSGGGGDGSALGAAAEMEAFDRGSPPVGFLPKMFAAAAAAAGKGPSYRGLLHAPPKEKRPAAAILLHLPPHWIRADKWDRPGPLGRRPTSRWSKEGSKEGQNKKLYPSILFSIV